MPKTWRKHTGKTQEELQAKRKQSLGSNLWSSNTSRCPLGHPHKSLLTSICELWQKKNSTLSLALGLCNSQKWYILKLYINFFVNKQSNKESTNKTYTMHSHFCYKVVIIRCLFFAFILIRHNEFRGYPISWNVSPRHWRQRFLYRDVPLSIMDLSGRWGQSKWNYAMP